MNHIEAPISNQDHNIYYRLPLLQILYSSLHQVSPLPRLLIATHKLLSPPPDLFDPPATRASFPY